MGEVNPADAVGASPSKAQLRKQGALRERRAQAPPPMSRSTLEQVQQEVGKDCARKL